MSRPRILVAEDERNIRQGLVDALESEGYQVDPAPDGLQAQALLKANPYDLALLDVMMPGLDGYSLCQSLRQSSPQIGIILVTAKGQEIDKVLGLKLGADDYIAKPFGLNELLARVEAALRRCRLARAPSAEPPLPETFPFGPLLVDRPAYEIRNPATAAATPLTARELKLLEAFHLHPAKALTRNHLLDAVWGIEYYGTTRTLDQHIAQLRKKLASLAAPPDLIETLHGIGYRHRP